MESQSEALEALNAIMNALTDVHEWHLKVRHLCAASGVDEPWQIPRSQNAVIEARSHVMVALSLLS